MFLVTSNGERARWPGSQPARIRVSWRVDSERTERENHPIYRPCDRLDPQYPNWAFGGGAYKAYSQFLTTVVDCPCDSLGTSGNGHYRRLGTLQCKLDLSRVRESADMVIGIECWQYITHSTAIDPVPFLPSGLPARLRLLMLSATLFGSEWLLLRDLFFTPPVVEFGYVRTREIIANHLLT